MAKKKKNPEQQSKPSNRRASKNSAGYGNVIALVLVLLVVTVAVVCNSKNNSASDGMPDSIIEKKAPNSATEKKASSSRKFPNYEEYTQLALEKKWDIKDPMDKFRSSLNKYGKLNGEDKQILKMLQTELTFLLEVFKASNDRQLDLTLLLAESLQVTQRCMFNRIKHILHSGSFNVSKSVKLRMITQEMVDKQTSDWIYYPAQRLLKIAHLNYYRSFNSSASPEEPVTSHITIDTHSPSIQHAGVSSLLDMVVKMRFHRLIPGFVQLGPSVAEMLMCMAQAVYNGDDFALGIIIRLMKVQHATATLHASDITDYTLYVTKILLPEAAQRKYEHIGSRIMTELLPWLTRESVTTHVNPGTTDMSLNSHNELFASEYYTTRKRSAKEDQPAVELRESSVFQKCTVDTVHIDLLTPAKFRAQYVRRNEPVLIQVGNSSLLNHLADRWSSKTLSANDGSRKVQSGSIPYASLFGLAKTEKSVSLLDYHRYMKRYHKQLEERLKNFNLTVDWHSLSNDDLSKLSTLFQIFSTTSENSNFTVPSYVFDSKILTTSFGDGVLDLIYNSNLYESDPVGVEMLDKFVDHRGGGSKYASLLDFISSVSNPIPDEAQSGGEGATVSRIDTETLHWQWFLGPMLSGAPFHYHAPALNVLVRGQKLWHLLPPGRDLYSSIHPVEWWVAMYATHPGQQEKRSEFYPYYGSESTHNEVNHDVLPCTLVQEAGEVLYVPRHFSHQIINLKESVGFAVEVSKY